MPSIISIEAQIQCIPHLEVELNSTLDSYSLMHQFFSQMLLNLNHQIIYRQDEAYNFQTIHGRQIRKLMLQHYRKLYDMVEQQTSNLDQIRSRISEKHTEICSNITYIQPIIKQIKHKNMVLVNEYAQIEKSIEMLEKQENQRKQNHFLKQIQQRYKMNENNSRKLHSSMISNNSSRSRSVSVSASYLGQLKELLQLKQKQIDSYFTIQNKISSEMIKNISQMLEQSMGNGLYQLQKQVEDIIFDLSDLKTNQQFDTFELTQRQKEIRIVDSIRKKLYQSSQIQQSAPINTHQKSLFSVDKNLNTNMKAKPLQKIDQQENQSQSKYIRSKNCQQTLIRKYRYHQQQ